MDKRRLQYLEAYQQQLRAAKARSRGHGQLRMNTDSSAAHQAPSQQPERQAAFKQFSASELYCPKCKQAMPVRERLLLVLPSGNKYDYVCTGCGSSIGDKTSKD